MARNGPWLNKITDAKLKAFIAKFKSLHRHPLNKYLCMTCKTFLWTIIRSLLIIAVFNEMWYLPARLFLSGDLRIGVFIASKLLFSRWHLDWLFLCWSAHDLFLSFYLFIVQSITCLVRRCLLLCHWPFEVHSNRIRAPKRSAKLFL